MKYLPQLTFTRFVAAFMVVAFHFGQTAWPLSGSIFAPLVREGGLAVGYFFVLSGFVMTWVYLEKVGKKGWKKSYTKARIARIVPLYWASSLITLLLGMWLRDEYPRGLAIILQSLFLHAWVPGSAFAVNFPSWSVSVEALFYLVFPLVLPLLKGRKTWQLLLVAALAWAATQVAYVTMPSWAPVFPADHTSDFQLRFPLWHLNEFILGTCGAIFFIRNRQRIGNALALGMLVISSVALIGICSFPNPALAYAADGMLAPLFVAFILGLAALPLPAAKVLGHPVLVFLGEISYAIYLLQTPVYMLWEHVLGKGGVTSNLFWPYLATLVACSALSWKVLEKPAQKWLRRKL